MKYFSHESQGSLVPSQALSQASQEALVVKELPVNAGVLRDEGLIPREGHGHPLQYSCLEDPSDRGTWQAIVHEVRKSPTKEAT